MRVPRAVGGLITALAACHVSATYPLIEPSGEPSERVMHAEAATAGPATIVLTDAGLLRFVEPLSCPSEDLVHEHATIERATRPNLATFTVGVIAGALGGIALTAGLFSARPGASPATYAGAAGVAIGVPLAIGPWLGDRRTREPVAGGDTLVRRPGPSQPCGERPIRARSATVRSAGLEIRGEVDADGVFAIAPYQWIDAFAAAQAANAAELTAVVDGVPRAITAVLAPRALAAHAAAWIAHAGFDASIAPMQHVPGIVPGALRASLTSTALGPALRVVLPLHNDGPGDAWAVRGQLTAPAIPAIDGRMLYVGKLARAASASPELVIPLADAVAASLRGASVELSIELRDAHDTAPTAPVRFHGALVSER